MVNRKSVFALLFPLKFDCERSDAVAHTYFNHLK